MALLGIRFDLRNPRWAGTSMAERYAAALDMAEWADRLGVLFVGLSEHHGHDDGVCPSPVTMAAAMAARTARARLALSALVSSFHDPLRLAEDLAVLDQLSRGRVDVTIANGYVGSEFEMFDRPLDQRPARTTEMVATLRAAWTGEPFEYRGRMVRVTPAPFQPGGPRLVLGGSTPGAARRAARIGDGFQPSTPEVWVHYRREMHRLGKSDPGPGAGGGTAVVHLARDPDEGWAAIAPFVLHEANSYGSWLEQAGLGAAGGYRQAADPEELRRAGQYRVLTPAQLTSELRHAGPTAFLLLHPMVGGIPPALAWSSLALLEREVLPEL